MSFTCMCTWGGGGCDPSAHELVFRIVTEHCWYNRDRLLASAAGSSVPSVLNVNW